MAAGKQRSWLVPVVLAAALALGLCVAALPLILLFDLGPRFDAEDAKVRLVFQVAMESHDDADDVLESVRDSFERRLRSSGDVSGFLVRVSGDDRIEVLTGELTESQQHGIIDLLTRPGTLEFSLLGNQYDHATLIADATAEAEAESEDGEWAWISLEPDADIGTHGGVVSRVAESDDSSSPEYLVVRDLPEMRITGDRLEWAMVGRSASGNPALDFKFDQRGSFLLQQLTTANAPRPGAGFKSRLAIILDGKIHSAPVINEMVAGRGQITGNFTEAEVRRLAAALTAGELPAPVECVEIESLDAE